MCVLKYKVKKGFKWFIKYYVKENGITIQKTKRGFNTKQEAKLLLNRRNDCSILFSTMCDRYIDDCNLKKLAPGTMEYKQTIISRFLLPFFGDTPVNKINQPQILDWQKTIKEKFPILSEGYLYNINHQLFYIFDYAVNIYNLESNPARKCGSIGHHFIDHNAFWTIDEFNRFIVLLNDKALNKQNNIKRKVDDRVLTIAFKLLFFTGLRISELLGLTVNDFDRNNHTISVNKQYNHNEFRNPKTRASKRTITLAQEPLKALHELLDLVTYNSGNDRLFYLINASNLRRALDSTCRISGLKRIRLHDLRHSCCALLSEFDVPIKKVQNFMGHSKVSTTMDYYGHVYENDLSDVADTIDSKLYKHKK